MTMLGKRAIAMPARYVQLRTVRVRIVPAVDNQLSAHIHPGHLASQRVARAAGLAPTTDVYEGEVRWTSPPAVPGREPGPYGG